MSTKGATIALVREDASSDTYYMVVTVEEMGLTLKRALGNKAPKQRPKITDEDRR